MTDSLRLATWNLNHRVGKVPFRPEAAAAAMSLDTDIMVFTEFYPRAQEASFRGALADAGWTHHLLSPPTGEAANRVLVVSRVPLEPLEHAPPTFDDQFPANLVCARVPSHRLALIGLRVPWYTRSDPLVRAWEWLEQTAARLAHEPAVLLGDLNVSTTSYPVHIRQRFLGILDRGWHRAQPDGQASYFGTGGVLTEIDHVIGTRHCAFSDAAYVVASGGHALAGSPAAISDHAALVTQVSITRANEPDARGQ